MASLVAINGNESQKLEPNKVYKTSKGDRVQVLPNGKLLRLRGQLDEKTMASIPQGPSWLDALILTVPMDTPASLMAKTVFTEDLKDLPESGGGRQTAALLERKPALREEEEFQTGVAQSKVAEFTTLVPVDSGVGEPDLVPSVDVVAAVESGRVTESDLLRSGVRQQAITSAREWIERRDSNDRLWEEHQAEQERQRVADALQEARGIEENNLFPDLPEGTSIEDFQTNIAEDDDERVTPEMAARARAALERRAAAKVEQVQTKLRARYPWLDFGAGVDLVALLSRGASPSELAAANFTPVDIARAQAGFRVAQAQERLEQRYGVDTQQAVDLTALLRRGATSDELVAAGYTSADVDDAQGWLTLLREQSFGTGAPLDVVNDVLRRGDTDAAPSPQLGLPPAATLRGNRPITGQSVIAATQDGVDPAIAAAMLDDYRKNYPSEQEWGKFLKGFVPLAWTQDAFEVTAPSKESRQKGGRVARLTQQGAITEEEAQKVLAESRPVIERNPEFTSLHMAAAVIGDVLLLAPLAGKPIKAAATSLASTLRSAGVPLRRAQAIAKAYDGYSTAVESGNLARIQAAGEQLSMLGREIGNPQILRHGRVITENARVLAKVPAGGSREAKHSFLRGQGFTRKQADDFLSLVEAAQKAQAGPRNLAAIVREAVPPAPHLPSRTSHLRPGLGRAKPAPVKPAPVAASPKVVRKPQRSVRERIATVRAKPKAEPKPQPKPDAPRKPKSVLAEPPADGVRRIRKQPQRLDRPKATPLQEKLAALRSKPKAAPKPKPVAQAKPKWKLPEKPRVSTVGKPEAAPLRAPMPDPSPTPVRTPSTQSDNDTRRKGAVVVAGAGAAAIAAKPDEWAQPREAALPATRTQPALAPRPGVSSQPVPTPFISTRTQPATAPSPGVQPQPGTLPLLRQATPTPVATTITTPVTTTSTGTTAGDGQTTDEDQPTDAPPGGGKPRDPDNPRTPKRPKIEEPRPPKRPKPRFRLPDGSELEEGEYPHIIEFYLGPFLHRIDLLTGHRDIKHTEFSGKPDETFRVVRTSSKPPKRRRYDQGVTDYIVTREAIDFVADRNQETQQPVAARKEPSLMANRRQWKQHGYESSMDDDYPDDEYPEDEHLEDEFALDDDFGDDSPRARDDGADEFGIVDIDDGFDDDDDIEPIDEYRVDNDFGMDDKFAEDDFRVNDARGDGDLEPAGEFQEAGFKLPNGEVLPPGQYPRIFSFKDGLTVNTVNLETGETYSAPAVTPGTPQDSFTVDEWTTEPPQTKKRVLDFVVTPDGLVVVPKRKQSGGLKARPMFRDGGVRSRR